VHLMLNLYYTLAPVNILMHTKHVAATIFSHGQDRKIFACFTAERGSPKYFPQPKAPSKPKAIFEICFAVSEKCFTDLKSKDGTTLRYVQNLYTTYLGIKSYRTSVTYLNLIFEAYRTIVPYL